MPNDKKMKKKHHVEEKTSIRFRSNDKQKRKWLLKEASDENGKAEKVLTIHQEPQRYSFFLSLPSEINDGSKLQRANSEVADKRKAETDKKSSSAIFKKTRQWKVEECQSFVAED
ncbi:hypothetical protein RUM43_012325 [Polyplax serrata]|uniref:Uncharacterized protein n=1 Tax=Polyplax serrata TaxID=468196 RepID=A0AAN8PTM3_POLSC